MGLNKPKKADKDKEKEKDKDISKPVFTSQEKDISPKEHKDILSILTIESSKDNAGRAKYGH